MPQLLSRARLVVTRAWNGPAEIPRAMKLEWQLVPARWLAISFVAPGLLLTNFSASQLVTAYIVLALGVVFNSAIQWSMPRYPAVFASGYASTIGDSLLSIAMVTVAGGSDSALASVFFVLIVAAAMRLGYGPSLAVALLVVGVNAIENIVAARPVDGSFVFRSGFLGLTAVLTSFLESRARTAETDLLRERLDQACALNTALEHQALHDLLTDLPNRALLHDRLHQAILAGQRTGTPLALLLLDLNRFKDVNDTLGHHYGDQLLRQIGPRLCGGLRASDTFARLGGDEFAVLLPGVHREGACSVARKLTHLLEAPFNVHGYDVEVGASIGIAMWPDHGPDVDSLLQHADVAMYAAKSAGGDYAVYVPEQDHHSPEQLALAGELRKAIDQDELLLLYQPKVCIKTGRVLGVEALVRWNHPRRGLLLPDQFIPLAEQTGLIRPLSRWLLNASLQQCHAWRAAAIDLVVAVNLSMRDLLDPEVPDIIHSRLRHWHTPASRLVIEITESSLLADAARAMDILSRLRRMGVGIAIDDYGTGYSSLARLKRLPVNELKIDRLFVQHMATDANDAAIVRSTISLAHDLGLLVVAEGVEDGRAWTMLAAMGCDMAQGYYLAHPLPASELTAWLASPRSTSDAWSQAA